MPRAHIDERYLDAPYYLVPNDKVGQDACAVMRGKAMVALGRVVLAKRERVIKLQPWGKGLMGTTLRYAYEVRAASSYFDDLSVPNDILKLAEHILESKAGDFKPALLANMKRAQVVLAGIAAELTTMSIVKPSGGRWHTQTVMRALSRAILLHAPLFSYQASRRVLERSP